MSFINVIEDMLQKHSVFDLLLTNCKVKQDLCPGTKSDTGERFPANIAGDTLF